MELLVKYGASIQAITEVEKCFVSCRNIPFLSPFLLPFFLSPLHASPSLMFYLNEEAPSFTPVQRSKTALALFRSRASHQYTWLHLWAT